MSESRFIKRVSTLHGLSYNCSHDNLNLTIYVMTVAVVHLLRDTMSLGK